MPWIKPLCFTDNRTEIISAVASIHMPINLFLDTVNPRYFLGFVLWSKGFERRLMKSVIPQCSVFSARIKHSRGGSCPLISGLRWREYVFNGKAVNKIIMELFFTLEMDKMIGTLQHFSLYMGSFVSYLVSVKTVMITLIKI